MKTFLVTAFLALSAISVNSVSIQRVGVKERQFFYTSKKSWRGYIFTSVCLCVCVCVFVCLCVCVSVCPDFLWTKFQPAERMHRFGRGFRWMIAYRTGSNPIEIGDLVPKVKVTVTENVWKNRQNVRSRHFRNQISSFDWKFYRHHFDTKYDHIAK